MFNRDGAIHFSSLKYIGTSPAHYVHAVKRTGFDTPAMRIGRTAHGLILLGEEPVVFDGTRRGAPWKDFCAERELTIGTITDEDGRTHGAVEDVLTPPEYDKVCQMRDAVRRDPWAIEILDRCQERETSLAWTLRGMPCKGRTDFSGHGILGDLKTCAGSAPYKFLRDAEKMGYDAQLPWYDVARGIVPIGPDTEWSEQYIIAVESVAPFPVVVYRLAPLRIDQGWAKCEEWLTTLENCIESGAWGGYVQGIQDWDGRIDFGDADEIDAEDTDDAEASE